MSSYAFQNSRKDTQVFGTCFGSFVPPERLPNHEHLLKDQQNQKKKNNNNKEIKKKKPNKKIERSRTEEGGTPRVPTLIIDD